MEHRRDLAAASASRLLALDRPRSLGVRLTPVALTGFGVLAGLFALWTFLGRVLSSDRGIDTTDEALYVLAADPPSRTASWNVPWGWHTRPLFVLVGEDIARFRTAGALIVVIGGALAAVMATRATLWLAQPVVVLGSGGRGRQPLPVLAGAGAFVGGSGALFLYADLLRTPGYNWVNLVGLTIAVGAFCGFVAEAQPATPKLLARHRWPAIVACGLFVTLPAKPSTAPIMIVVFGIAAAMTSGFLRAWWLVRWVSAWLAVVVAVAVGIGFWPWSLRRTVERTIGLPPLDRPQTVGGAISEFLTLPNRLLDAIRDFPVGVTVALSVAVVLAVASGSPRTSDRLSGCLRFVALVVCAVAALHVAAVPLPGIDVERPPRRLNLTSATTGGLVTVFGGACAVVPSWRALSSARQQWRRWVHAAAVPFVLVAAPFVFSFGSANTPYMQASMAVGFLLVASFSLAVRHAARLPITGGLAAATIVATALAMSAVTLVESRDHPYRSPPLDAMTVPVALGADGSELLVQPELAAHVGSLRSAAAEAGWNEGMPVLGVMWRWSSMEPLALAAEVPDSLMLTLFGYGGSAEWAEYNVDDLDGERWNGAWLLLTDPRVLDRGQRASVDGVLALLEPQVGRSFPNGYQCVATIDDVQLWRPADGPSPSSDVDCPRSG